MILTFADPETSAFFRDGRKPKSGWQNVAKIASRKLDMVHAAERLDDLRSPPGNLLEALKADRSVSTAFGSTINGACASLGLTRDRPASKSRIIIEEGTMRRLTTHPGEILMEEFMVPLNLSARALAAEIGVPPNRVTAIINETRGVTADTAIRLGLYFNTTSGFWLNLQQSYDVSKAERDGDFDGIKPRIMA